MMQSYNNGGRLAFLCDSKYSHVKPPTGLGNSIEYQSNHSTPQQAYRSVLDNSISSSVASKDAGDGLSRSTPRQAYRSNHSTPQQSYRSMLDKSISSSVPSTNVGSDVLSRSSSLSPSPVQSPRWPVSRLSPFGEPSAAYIQKKTLIEAGLEVRAELGCGNQSSLHLAWKGPAEMFRCVKRYQKHAMSSDAVSCMMQEYQTMKSVEMHPNVGKVFDLFQESDLFHIEMEFHEGGDFTTMKARATSASVSLTETWWNNVLSQCLSALSYVHSKGIVHCDVKEPNLMLKSTNYHNPVVVLIDFGIAQEEGIVRNTTYGTPGYVPPEVWRTYKWEAKGDMFSLGVTILQVLIDRVPSQKHPNNGIFVENTNYLNGIAAATQTREPPIHLIPPCYHHLPALVGQLLFKDLKQRPSALEAQGFLSHNWLTWPTMSEESLVADSGDAESRIPGNFSVGTKGDDVGFAPWVFGSAIVPVLLLALL